VRVSLGCSLCREIRCNADKKTRRKLEFEEKVKKNHLDAMAAADF
jgi:hypothetical protein